MNRETFRTRFLMEMHLLEKLMNFPSLRPLKNRLCYIHSTRIIKMGLFCCLLPASIID